MFVTNPTLGQDIFLAPQSIKQLWAVNGDPKETAILSNTAQNRDFRDKTQQRINTYELKIAN